MERLTDPCWKNLDPWECCGQDSFCKRGCHEAGGCTNGCIVPKLYVRVAMYEDAGLSPLGAKHAAEIENGLNEDGYSIERMVELMKADKEGRIVVLPCKLGVDMVNRILSEQPFPMENDIDGSCVSKQMIEMSKQISRRSKPDLVRVTRCRNCAYYKNHPNGLCYLHTEPKANERGYSG